MRVWRWMAVLLAGLTMHGLAAQTPDGQVQLPLDHYNQLYDKTRAQPEVKPSAPARYSLGSARVNATILEEQARATAQVTVTLEITLFDSDWVLVPVLPAGTPVKQATVSGKAVSLVPSVQGLAWTTQGTSGDVEMLLVYEMDALRSESGYTVALPVPAAASTSLQAQLPGKGLDVAVVPAAGTQVRTSGETTSVEATIPATSGIQLSWRVPTKEGHAISRAAYTGTLEGDALVWKGSLDVELFSDDTVTLRLLPATTILGDVTVDRRHTSIITDAGYFAALVKGRGTHTVEVAFETPVSRGEGPPSISLSIPKVPVSKFEVTLPGKKELSVTPGSNVSRRESGDRSVATFLLPMTDSVQLSWSEAVPEEVRTEVRANASIYHAAHVEEGVLYLTAMVVLEVTRGETNSIELEVPEGVQVNRISATDGGVADWRVVPGARGKPATASIFLDRQVSGEFLFSVEYEQLLASGDKVEQEVTIPCLKALGVHRQRGMIALLAGKELALKPVEEERVRRVGENDLPAFVRDAINMTVAHTYHYIDENPLLVAQVTKPERKEGRFESQVNTLISLGDATMYGVATVDIHVKSGALESVQLSLPAGVDVLNVTVPSLRDHEVKPDGDAQVIDVYFTQDMEGQFRIECTYQRILTDGQSDLEVPTLSVRGAEVEQGRIAVEALSAVEVQAAATEQLTTLDVKDLPRQLVLKTTNPILLAYKYIHSDPPPKLTLRVTRHQEVQTQEAIIDEARYLTLYTRDGDAITSAWFKVRNSRKQFLKIRIPERSEVWKAYVNGNEEKPVVERQTEKDGGTQDARPTYLIKIINSTQGFPVYLEYATRVDKVGALGTIAGHLPEPDMLVTHSIWDVFLPDGLGYQAPKSNMRVVQGGYFLSEQQVAQKIVQAPQELLEGQSTQLLSALRPTNCIYYSFEKLYASRSDDVASFSIAYASEGGMSLATILSVLGALLFWFVLGLRVFRPAFAGQWGTRQGTLVVGILGALVSVGTIVFLGVDWGYVFVISLLGVLVLGVLWIRAHFPDLLKRKRDKGTTASETEPVVEQPEPPEKNAETGSSSMKQSASPGGNAETGSPTTPPGEGSRGREFGTDGRGVDWEVGGGLDGHDLETDGGGDNVSTQLPDLSGASDEESEVVEEDEEE